MNCAIADTVSRDLQPRLDGRFDDLVELVRLNHQDAAIVGVADEINVAESPRLPHVGAAGEHAAVEEAQIGRAHV